MTYVAGIYVPDDVYNSLVNVIATEKNTLMGSGLSVLCNPIVQALLPPSSPILALCITTDALIQYLAQQVANMVQKTEQEVVQQINSLQAQGKKVTAITFTFKGENFIALVLKNTTLVQNPLTSWLISQITNIELNALQSAVNQFNSTTLNTINQQLTPEGWQLNPISVSYDSNTDTFILTATYQKMHTPDPQAWMILVIVIILAVVAMTYIITNYLIQTETIQYQKQIAQNSYQLYQQCLQDTNNNVQLCQQLMNEYLQNTQPSSSSSTASDILIGIGVAAALIGAGILVYSLGKSKGS